MNGRPRNGDEFAKYLRRLDLSVVLARVRRVGDEIVGFCIAGEATRKLEQ